MSVRPTIAPKSRPRDSTTAYVCHVLVSLLLISFLPRGAPEPFSLAAVSSTRTVGSALVCQKDSLVYAMRAALPQHSRAYHVLCCKPLFQRRPQLRTPQLDLSRRPEACPQILQTSPPSGPALTVSDLAT